VVEAGGSRARGIVAGDHSGSENCGGDNGRCAPVGSDGCGWCTSVVLAELEPRRDVAAEGFCSARSLVLLVERWNEAATS